MVLSLASLHGNKTAKSKYLATKVRDEEVFIY